MKTPYLGVHQTGSSSQSGAQCCEEVRIIGRVIVQRTGQIIDTIEGRMALGEAVVRETLPMLNLRFEHPIQTTFLRELARDGYVVELDDRGKNPTLRSALPEEIVLPASDNEVHELLKLYQFVVPKGHLDQAIAARSLRSSNWPVSWRTPWSAVGDPDPHRRKAGGETPFCDTPPTDLPTQIAM